MVEEVDWVWAVYAEGNKGKCKARDKSKCPYHVRHFDKNEKAANEYSEQILEEKHELIPKAKITASNGVDGSNLPPVRDESDNSPRNIEELEHEIVERSIQDGGGNDGFYKYTVRCFCSHCDGHYDCDMISGDCGEGCGCNGIEDKCSECSCFCWAEAVVKNHKYWNYVPPLLTNVKGRWADDVLPVDLNRMRHILTRHAPGANPNNPEEDFPSEYDIAVVIDEIMKQDREKGPDKRERGVKGEWFASGTYRKQHFLITLILDHMRSSKHNIKFITTAHPHNRMEGYYDGN